jgi:pterin-4a-carbinolamine dehydratase
MEEKLTDNEIQSELKDLSGWSYTDGSIKKTFKTQNYPSTMGFVTAVGGICQKKNHHPDYILMKFKEVEVSFSTHSAKGITKNDIEVAKEIEKITL